MTLSGQVYKCSAGETFDSIALAIYDDENYASDLMNANPALCRLQIFAGGEELQLPVIEVVENENDEDDDDYMPAKAPWKE